MDTIWSMVTRLYGEYGASRTGLALINYNAEDRTAIIRTMLITIDLVKAALAATTKIGNRSATIHVLAVSGTIRALQKKMNHRLP